MSYATDFIEGYLKPFNIQEFTHRDILIHTTTNCSYGVLVDLKMLKVYKIEDKDEDER